MTDMTFINLSVFSTTPQKALSLPLYLKMRLIMKRLFRCPHLFAKSSCIPQTPSITYMVFCSVVLHTFYWINTGPFLFCPKKSPPPQMLYNSMNAVLALYLGDFFASSPNVIPHLVFCCVKEGSDDRFHFPEFITYCVYCGSVTMTPSAFRLNGGPHPDPI